MLDFYAGGTSEDYSLRISPQGGTLSVNDYLSMGLMPWGYVTAEWPTGKIYIIFLVNVTQTNFRIGFLYLTNSSDEAFILRWFDYASDNINVWTFQGIQHVYNRTVPTPSIPLPKLRILAAAKVTNGLSALGQQLYLTSTYGEWLNGTTPLSIYPLYNQYFTGASDYNEVWSLLVDNIGNYYFAILYMPNSDASHVIIEHQLRLNDYQRLNGVTVAANWIRGDFGNQVTVRTPASNLTVKVDGFPFQTNQNGIFTTGVPKGTLTVEVPPEILESANTKLIFSHWNEYGNSNPLRVILNSTLDVAAKYDQEYSVDINSPYEDLQGSGWYVKGTNLTFAVNSPIDLGNGTRRVFLQWEGGVNSSSPQSWATVNSPLDITALWKTQYALTISAPGLPANTTANLLVGNDQVVLNGSGPVTEWVDADQQLSINVQSQHIQGPAGNYSLVELRADNQTFGGLVYVSQPITIWLMYSTSPRPAPPISQPTDSYGLLSILLTNGLLAARNIPSLSPLISVTATLANLGYLLAAFIVPGGPPIMGYLLGSLFIGLIYVFPMSALVLLYRSARTRRQPNLRTLTPLAIIWGVSLTLILLNPEVLKLQSLFAALQLLLVLSTMLLFPLLIAFRMARLVTRASN
jgi:hypothetical protein